MSDLSATPDVPETPVNSAVVRPAVKPATPDLILFDDAEIPLEFITNLLFEQIGGREIITISRNDLIGGQNVSYNLISNSSQLAQTYSSNNIFRVPGTAAEFFENFAIKFKNHVPENGTGPAKFYVGAENSFGCTGFPVLGRIDDAVFGCFSTFSEAQSVAEEQSKIRDIVYSDPNTGDIVVDVVNLRTNDRVEIEILAAGTLENDTIY